MHEDLKTYKTIFKTLNMFLNDIQEHLQWRPKQGASIFYEESWTDRLIEVKITRRAAIAIYKMNNIQ